MAKAADIQSNRLGKQQLAANFTDLHPPLSAHEALVESDRCYFCYDAPCQQACPTSIDIPLFIRQIAASNDLGAAETILSANILGGMCARVCPTETLCEEACVREAAEGKPVRIGQLQRLAIGGIEVKLGAALGQDVDLAKLRQDHDAVFLGLGLAGVNKLGLEAPLEGVIDAVEYIATLRQAQDLSKLPVGRRVVVIGGGM